MRGVLCVTSPKKCRIVELRAVFDAEEASPGFDLRTGGTQWHGV